MRRVFRRFQWGHFNKTVMRCQARFVIAVGFHVQPLTETAIRVGEKIDPVTVDMGNILSGFPFGRTQLLALTPL
jgi:hypothetical protein